MDNIFFAQGVLHLYTKHVWATCVGVTFSLHRAKHTVCVCVWVRVEGVIQLQ